MAIKALLVDDEPSYSEILASRLHLRGIEAKSAQCGESAIELMEKESFDVVVLDLFMPGMGGLDVLKRIKSKNENIEVIILTGQAEVQSAVEGMRLGSFDYLSKPIKLEALMERINSAFVRRMTAFEKERMIDLERLASIGRLAEGVAHEINNPVNVIYNEAAWIEESLEDFIDDFEEVRKSAVKIRKQCKRCKEITYKLLSLGRRTDPRLVSVDVNKLVQDKLAALSERLGRSNITAIARLEAEKSLIQAPLADINQLLDNLVSNAVDAMEENGGTMEIRTSATDGSLEICITDEGIGIPAENAPKIFEPFFSTKEVGKGTGLGLSIALGIVRAMHGELKFASEPGKGSSFTIRLPL